MVSNLHVRSLLFTALGILSFIATLGSSAPVAPAQTSQITNDIAVRLSESRSVLLPGQHVTFTVWLTNHGPDDATFVDVGFTLPAQLKIVSMKCDQGISPDGAFCEYSSLPAGATVMSWLVATTNPAARTHARLLKISAAADFENPGILDPDLGNNSASVRLRLAGRSTAP